MSGIDMSDLPPLDLREQIARIDRMRDESEKFKAEQQKLIAEAAKLNRDRLVAPWLAIASVVGGALGLATFMSRLLGR
jgi:hypothetical protein